jgi:hypothetical protein
MNISTKKSVLYKIQLNTSYNTIHGVNFYMFQHWSAIFRESCDSFLFNRRPEDGTPVPKYVDVDIVNCILSGELIG